MLLIHFIALSLAGSKPGADPAPPRGRDAFGRTLPACPYAIGQTPAVYLERVLRNLPNDQVYWDQATNAIVVHRLALPIARLNPDFAGAVIALATRSTWTAPSGATYDLKRTRLYFPPITTRRPTPTRALPPARCSARLTHRSGR